MKLPTYTDVLKMGKEALQASLAIPRANRAKKQAELEMCKLDEQIATAEAAIIEACSKQEVNFADIIEKQDALALIERKKVQYQKILDEMFPQ